MATARIFTPVLASLGDPVPHDGILSPGELEQLAVDIVDRRDSWEPLVHRDAHNRRYELICEDERMDASVLSWMPAQGTGFHDHYISGVGLCSAASGVRGDLLVHGGNDIELHLRPGDARRGGPGYIHPVRHETGAPAVTIHVYCRASTGSVNTASRRTASCSAKCAPGGTS